MRTNRFAKLCLLLFGAALALASLANAETKILGNLQLSVQATLSPKKLPRERSAPISVSVGWQIQSTDPAQRPPALKSVKIEINRAGILDPTGLPDCPYAQIQPASTQRALANCRPSLVGQGSFAALVGLEGQESYASKGKMVVFKGTKAGKPVLYGQIYTAYPFAASFVIVFKVSKEQKGTYATTLKATLPANLRAWGNLTEVKMRLARNFSYKGQRRSFLSAACPAPKGFGAAPFPLARTSFSFNGAPPLSQILSETCKVRH
jgi:hypothetical protein